MKEAEAAAPPYLGRESQAEAECLCFRRELASWLD
jgi:hypothetical protein